MKSDRYGGSALITGASSGIGEAFAHELAARGHDLVLLARRESLLEALADTLRGAHAVVVQVVAIDLCEAGAVERLVKHLNEADTEIGLLINNAGIGTDGRSFADTPLDRMLAMVDLHCRATVELTYRLLPALRWRGRGGIIFTSSIAGFLPAPNYAVYGASKGFDLLLAEALWAELRASGIDVLALAPGRTDTGFFDVSGRPGAGVGSMPAARVAREALARLGRGPVHVPGWKNRAMTLLPRLLPRALVAGTLERVLGRRSRSERG